MSRLFRFLLPHPMLSFLTAVVWCLLINSLSLGTVVLAAFLGIVVPILTSPYWPNRPAAPKVGKLIVYVALVLWDILIANIGVAYIVLFRSNQKMRSRWVVVPLELKSPEAITILAGTITLTPGTVSADLSDKGRYLLVHALDTADPEEEAKEIKHRYERRLKEIFE
ncbi:Na+/H+ antiporter subunit E [Palleronia abyssalis]|uniref:Na(+)/H(+) antiporter subunit E1 n=1 Tax=Palleronia abyssalis TaxID=1501240 RepID=A0A2R8BSY4_9RHOB|nr:Na+/H+ antiporter subunit E [Palleronia abyssalis]SPJ23272.1 Na(+)/H(+) antiporter subunit E1 [Palleronia abyssalis]